MKFWEEGLRYRRGCEDDAGDWSPTPIAVALAAATDRTRLLMELARDTESPIETQLGAAILLLFGLWHIPIAYREAPASTVQPVLIPQFSWSFYRSDWAIVTARGTLLIECDGRDFHSSPEQVYHDQHKDLTAREQRFRTMRFTGSEIHRDVDGCVRQIFDAVLAL